MSRGRALAALAAAAVAVTAIGGTQAAEGRTHFKRPKAGQFIGQTHQKKELTLVVKGKRVSTAVAELKCTYRTERLSVHHLEIRKTKSGYAFALHGRRTVTFNDRHVPQKARVDFIGHFARGGTKAHGLVRVKSKYCGGSGKVRWSARHLAHPVHTPKSGEYDGQNAQGRRVALYTDGPSIQVAEMHFKCTDSADGATVLDSVPMRRTAKGYAFAIKAHGSVTYSDGYPDENAEVDISGRFSRSGKTARGHMRVKSPRCGGTGQVAFSVKPHRSGKAASHPSGSFRGRPIAVSTDRA